MGGDHCLAVGSVAAVARHCAEADRPFATIWLDAHADFNTPQTTPSDNIHGMPVAILCGDGPPELTELGPTSPIIDASQLFQVGIRSIDHVEKHAVVDSALAVYDMRTIDERGMRAVMAEALEAVAERGAPSSWWRACSESRS